MSTHASMLGAVEYSAEAAFGENLATMTARLPVLGRVDVAGLKQEKIEIPISRQRMNEGTQNLRGPMGGSVSLEFMLPGLGSTAAGAIPASDMATFLGLIAGNVTQSAASGTTVAAGSTTTVVNTVASGTLAPGSLIRIGALSESRGKGQGYAVSSHAATVLTLLNAAVGAPSAADVIYTGRNIYGIETPATSGDVTGLRLALRTANQQYILHGCYPTALTFSELGPGKQPKVSITLGVAWWETANDTFPVATAMQTHSGMTVAGGSLFINAIGTSTRATRDVRDFELAIAMETVALMGQGGNHAYQTVVAARRTKSTATLTWTVDAEAAGTNTFDAIWSTDENEVINRHALYTVNTRDGASATFYFPNLVPVGDRAVQFEANGLNCMRESYRCDTAPSGATDLLRSPWRLGLH